MNSLVSVVMPAFNRAELIGESIQSVLGQTYRHFELIVVDDGSNDNTAEVVKSFHDERIQLVRLDHSGLIGKVRNAGVKITKGDFIAFHDSDDLWHPEKLQLQISLFQKIPSADYCFTNATQFGPDAIQPPDYPQLATGNLFQFLLRKKYCVYMPSLIVRRHVFEKTGFLNESYKSLADIDFFYRLAFSHDGIFTNNRLISIRKHESNNSIAFQEASYTELLNVYDSLLEEKMIGTPQHRTLKGNLLYSFGLEHLRRGNNRKALDSFVKGSLAAPWQWKSWLRIIQSSVMTTLR